MFSVPGEVSVPDIKPREFAQIKDFALDTFGLELRPGKERLVCARLGKHLRAGGFRNFDEYFKSVQQDRSGASLVVLIDALTTNHTSFLREPDHFRFLNSVILPRFIKRPMLKIWSAASSTGEEPYTVLFALQEALNGARTPDVRIVATDISSRVLATAREGIYSQERVAVLPSGWLTRFFDRIGTRENPAYRVKQMYKDAVSFRRLNLMEKFPNGEKYAAIFCRNVMIYFNKRTQADLVNRLADCLEPGGYLLVGHAESLTGIEHRLRYVQPAVYERPA